ncbi:MAG: phosphoribosyltransferase family protein [Cytophagales bacterium]
MENQIILSSQQVKQIIKRLAFEIYEHNYLEKEIILAGIFDKGYLLAAHLLAEFQAIGSRCQAKLLKVELDKFSPTQSAIKLDFAPELIKNKTVILIDDVLNSGRTLAYSLKPFLTVEIGKIQVAVLVDRGHKSFPVGADYVGYSLSTTLKEHIDVVFDEKDIVVYLK